ncbi:MAG: SIS domain-containing protein, partial [Candidatus Aenigmarchaeota archaeon]|nr:SIS domain-containing protein [Candidatus Aenigmarchaeota archaeon]
MEKIDLSNVIKVIDKFPEQCQKAIKLGTEVSKKIRIAKPKRVFVCGMGGSGIAGNILSGLYPDSNIRIFSDYTLPKYVKRGDLLFAVSYSGNTEETLAVFREARRRKCNIIGITS